MTKRQSLGARIAQARRELGVREHRDVTQADLASAVGVSAATLSRWEADVAVPRDSVFVKLAAVLGVAPGALRYGVMRPPDDEDFTLGAVALTPAQIQRAKEQAVRDRAAASAPPARPRKRGGQR